MCKYLVRLKNLGSFEQKNISTRILMSYKMGQMPNSAARRNLEEAIDAERAQAARRLRRYEEIAQKHNASQQPGGAPLVGGRLARVAQF